MREVGFVVGKGMVVVTYPGRSANASIDVSFSSLLIFFFSMDKRTMDMVIMPNSCAMSTIVTTPHLSG